MSILQSIIGELPRTVEQLDIQVDGSNENWNQTMLSFCNHLVLAGRFLRVVNSSFASWTRT